MNHRFNVSPFLLAPLFGALAVSGCAGSVDENNVFSTSSAYAPAQFNAATSVGQDFTTTSDWDRSVWTHQYGTGYWFSKTSNGVLLSMSASTGWQTTAIQQLTVAGNCAAGFGYGTFHYRAGIPAAQKGQGPGVNLILWRMDNDWIDGQLGNVITEDDIMEAWSGNGQGTATRHYYDAAKVNGGTNGQIFSGLGDVTGLHDYDEVWTTGRMTLYKDGVKVSELTGGQVPKDYAHGGCNYSMGAQVINPTGYTQVAYPTVQLWLANAWHSNSTTAPGGGAGGGGGGTVGGGGGSIGANVTFISSNSSKCIDVPGASSSAVQLQQYSCNGTGAQKFNVETNRNGSYTFVNASSGLCIDVSGDSSSDGAVVQQWPCNGSEAQQFTLSTVGGSANAYAIKTAHGACLDAFAELGLHGREQALRRPSTVIFAGYARAVI
ncbi:MAG: RICIN domain-containing protein [Myxococcales bacterium]|nr:RICIN domain-containing protein [Myxococcales bacterium]